MESLFCHLLVQVNGLLIACVPVSVATDRNSTKNNVPLPFSYAIRVSKTETKDEKSDLVNLPIYENWITSSMSWLVRE